MSDLTNLLFYEVTLKELYSDNVLDKLLLKSQQDVALLLKKMAVSKTIIEGGFSHSMSFLHNNVWIDIVRLEPHNLNFNHKAYSTERGDSMFEIFTMDLVVKLKPLFRKFKEYCDYNLEYSDNFRIGIKDCEESMEEFDSLCSCCGEYYQTEYIDGYGEVIFGCNYGH